MLHADPEEVKAAQEREVAAEAARQVAEEQGTACQNNVIHMEGSNDIFTSYAQLLLLERHQSRETQ